VTRADSRLIAKSNEEAIQIVLEAIGAAGLQAGEQVSIALDPASSRILRQEQRQSTSSRNQTSLPTHRGNGGLLDGLDGEISDRFD